MKNPPSPKSASSTSCSWKEGENHKPLHVVCAAVHTDNRMPAGREREAPRCGNCGADFLDGKRTAPDEMPGYDFLVATMPTLVYLPILYQAVRCRETAAKTLARYDWRHAARSRPHALTG